MLHDNLYIRLFFSVFEFYALLSKYAQYPEQRVQNFKPVTDLDCIEELGYTICLLVLVIHIMCSTLYNILSFSSINSTRP